MGSVARQQACDRAVPEVEHEAGALVAVVEQIRLTTGGDEQDVAQVRLGEQEVAREPQATGVPQETFAYSSAYAFTQPSRCAIHGDTCQTG